MPETKKSRKAGPRDRPRALVVGGSMSGLFAALLLRRRGWDVDIYERVEGELAGRGAGIVAQPEMRTVIEALGLDPGDSLGVLIDGRLTLDRDGRDVGACPLPQVMTAWERVYRLLRDAFPAERYHRGAKLDRVTQTAETVVAHFADGASAEGDLLVGADGLRSTVRMQYLPDLAANYAGYVAWRAMIDEAEIPAAIRDDLFRVMVFCLPPGEQALGYPVAGANEDLGRGRRRYNFVWYRPADNDKLAWMLTDAAGTTHDGSIPPPLVRREVIAEMRADAQRLLAPQLRSIVALAAQPFLQPIYDLESPQMAFGRVAVLGDAAFVARPHVGAGVAKAAEDGVALADALAVEPDVATALKRFEQARIGIGSRIVQRARQLGAYIQAERATPEERAYAERHFSPQAVMAETALLDFLHA